MSARTIGYLIILSVSGLLLIGWIVNLNPEGDRIEEMGPDLVVVERTDVFGSLQRAPVAFRHTVHTDALSEEGCEACHELDDEERPIPQFARGDLSRRQLMDTYHEECIGCHAERAGEDATGPRTCGTCHIPAVRWVPQRKPAGLDLALHQRHIDAFDDRCEECHHVYDEASEQLVHGEGQESSCRDCHGEVAVGDAPSLRDSAHTSCVGCHQLKGTQEAGPTDCAGCHLEGEIDPLTPMTDIPRLERDQPDQVTITVAHAPFLDVEFDHASHEGFASSCRTCHHQKLDRCGSCHTYEGSAEGDFVQLGDAFHEPDSVRSCTGCHVELARRDDNCAGCHGDGDLAAGPAEGACKVCHGDDAAALAALTDGEAPEDMLQQGEATEPGPREWGPPAPPPDDLAEVVQIDHLADRYEAVSFEHAAHIENLTEAGEQLDLSRPWHAGSAFTCIACHHDAEVDEDNQACTSCHAQRDSVADLTAPLDPMAAYHRQCVGCHQRMGVVAEETEQPLECTDCHAEAGKEGQP